MAIPTEKPSYGPLDGVKVVYAAVELACPKAADLMADWGADVVWLENTGAGDTIRDTAYVKQAERRNQRSVALNYFSEEGKKVFFDLVKDANIFMEASKGGTWARKGITDDMLWEANPKLVIVHVSGFGQWGDPERVNSAAYDLTVAAYIPERYVPSDRQRMDLYRRIAALRDNDAAADLIDELTDRYGDPPRPVTALLDVALLRAAAADTGVTDITQKGQTLLLSLGQRMDVPSLMAVCTLPAYRSRLLLSAGEHPKLTLHLKPGEEALDAAGHLVEALTLKRKEISGETPAEGGTL